MRTTWRESKDAGKQAFTEGKYDESLSFYSRALEQLTEDEHDEGNSNGNGGSGSTVNEHQILLSNVIACRLKIGGEEMATTAIAEAKKCVALNSQWPKAHVRLASAYIALGGHSNDACLSLQRALSLDRSNKVARDMLVREMRRRDQPPSADDGNSNDNNNSNTARSREQGSSASPSQSSRHDSSYHPTEETPRQYSATPSAPPPSPSMHQQTSSSNNSNNDGIDVDDVDEPPAGPLNFNSLSEQMQYYYVKAITWYQSQSDDAKTFLKVSTCFLLLYLALGGRFGLDYALGNSNTARHRGNYGQGNAYDRYRSRGTSSSSMGSGYNDKYSSSNNDYESGDYSTNARRQQSASTNSYSYETQRDSGTTSSGYNDRTNSRNDRHYSRYEDESYYEAPSRRTSTSTSFTMPNLFDGSLISMAILFVIGTICHKFGINPFQIFWLLNMVQRRQGGHHQGGGMRMGGFGGYGGYGGGFGGRRHGRYGVGRRRW